MRQLNVRLFTTVMFSSIVLWACTAPPTNLKDDDDDSSNRSSETDTESEGSSGAKVKGARETDDEDEPQPAACGDGVCKQGETCTSCAKDCGSCEPSEGGPPADECVAPSGLKLQDQDLTDSQLPWKRTGKQKVVIFFETNDVDAEFLEHMKKGAENWNKSPCLDVRLVDRCPAGANCVTVSAPNADSEDDGNFDAEEKGGFTLGGHIDVTTGLSRGERLNVMIHEMGHAVGLRHRKTEHVLMNGDTYDDVFVSDPIDYQNLLVLYGNQQ